MPHNLCTARPDDSLLYLLFHMVDSGVRHSPVIDTRGQTAGMVSIRDVIRPLLVGIFDG